MKLTKLRSSVPFSSTGLRPLLFGGLALFSFGALPMAACAQDAEAPLPAGGKQLLAATVFVAAALVGMERICSWRLGRRQRRTNDERQTPFAKRLPPTAGPAAGFSPAPES